MLSFDVTAWLFGVQTRSLIIAGEHDRLIAPALTRNIASLTPNSTYAEITGGGHICSVASAGAFTPLLLESAAFQPRQV